MVARYSIAIGFIIIFSFSLHLFSSSFDEPTVGDQSRLMAVKMKAVKAGTTTEELKKIVLDANKKDDVIAIAGMQHSQGGHTLYPKGILLDMKPYNKILSLDRQGKKITVQSGTSWAAIQEYINPSGLALQISQSQSIFTVGGSLSVNAHGLSIRNHSLIDTVDSFRLLTAKGEVLTVSREENQEMFPLAIGGYGLFGVILDVTLNLTDNELYEMSSHTLQYEDYPAYFKETVLSDKNYKMHLARLSISPDTFLKEMYVINYALAPHQSKLVDFLPLKREPIVAIPKFFLGMSRINDFGKRTFWETQKNYAKKVQGKLISRNNAMRSDSVFMEYTNPDKTEVLQEYFVPIDEFEHYLDDLRSVLEDDETFNLLNITVRYVEKNEEPLLAYATKDMFSLVLLINQGKDQNSIEQTRKTVQNMIDVTLAHNGSYYLPYYGYATKEQMKAAYPRSEEFFKLKNIYDPDHRFQNLFFEEYGDEH
ncbi:FAD/FMN-containing dehydrogenase [Planomicrobium soli]|uniref:FAD/FMN-containing dehydrogenase n=1 Tax=Planomicrobium soli TaxID=1176648 RepID=A0A2P8H6E5_9BACL|nr:FAD-binding oxidoreductase [Planomicrobium soli]PSL41764.1 FAD/FMN-containing dehydrogenase [Planomicrobium soli]